ncbi:hypothetical protein B4099_2453 [Heyndrickxia coagulans]|uniref:Uncharacterized protein n=1 Tax=Heyndrickxia coagulans TaxID=1398 RepID=A0A150JVP6_HEYCO|nr:hypothetical protein B4099_2453 [Heyndrickxia coagulans]
MHVIPQIFFRPGPGRHPEPLFIIFIVPVFKKVQKFASACHPPICYNKIKK